MRAFLYICITMSFVWGMYTIYVQWPASHFQEHYGETDAQHHALIVYHPDRIFDYDRRLCTSLAAQMTGHGWRVTLHSVDDADLEGYDLLVFCANTHNLAPDQSTMRAIDKAEALHGQPAVAITIGADSNLSAQRSLEHALQKKGCQLLDSSPIWSWSADASKHMSETHTKAADILVRTWTETVAERSM